jgi:hypothetical protein
MELVPHDLSSILSWLPDTLFPSLLARSPHLLGEFLAELSTFLCGLELSATVHWPADVLSVVEQLLVSISDLCPNHICPPDISPLTGLQEKLVKLASMPAILRNKLTLAAYEQSSPTELVYRALDQVVGLEDTKQLIVSALSQFAEEHRLNLDSLLYAYLKLFLERAPTHSPDFPDSPWEAKAVAVASSVASSESHVSCCLELLHRIQIPWSQPVASLIHDSLQLTAANSEELRSLYELLQMQAMLQEKYGIADFNFSDSSTGQLYISSILMQQRTGVLADALWVAARYNMEQSRVYIIHTFRLCCQNKVEQARDVIQSVHTSTAHAMLTFCLHRLKLPFIPGMSDPASHCGAAQLALLCTQLLSSPSDWTGECSSQQLRQVWALAVEFSVFLSPAQLAAPQHTAQLLRLHMANLHPSSVGNWPPCKTLRLGNLLGYSEHEVCCQLVAVWIQQSYEAISMRLLGSCPSDLTLPLLHSTLSGCGWSSLTPAQACGLCELAALLSSSCSPHQLHMVLLVFRACSLLRDMFSVCVREKRESWPWTARHSEPGLLLKLAQVRPLFLKLASTLLLPTSLNDATPLPAVVDLLQSNGHLSLAHHTAVEVSQHQLALFSGTNSMPLLSSALEKVLSMSLVDHSWGLAILLATPPNSALRLLNCRQASVLSSYSRIISLCLLTIHYCQLVSLPQIRSAALALLTGAVWGKVLRFYQVSFSDALRGGPQEKRRVLPQILCVKTIPPAIVLAYCRTYQLDGAGAMLTRLRMVLTDWETGYQNGYEASLASIRTHPFVPSLLDTFLTSKVCPYDYERVQFVLHQLPRQQPHHHQMQLLLSHLEGYVRSQPPSEQERSWHCARCHSVCRAGQTGCTQRLPLHLLLDRCHGLEIIGHEAHSISAATGLITMAHILNFPEDQFYGCVLKSLDVARLGFQELASLLASVSHTPTRLALTADLAPRLSGADRVAALEAALALLSDAACQDQPLDQCSLAQELRDAKARVVLEEAGLGWAMAADASVISALYTELPLQAGRPAAADVHHTLQRIADIYSVNMLTFTSQLLQEWLLPSPTGQRDLDTTLVREMEEVDSPGDGSSDENWQRMAYLLTDNPHSEHLAGVMCRWAKADCLALGPLPRQRALHLLLTAVPRSIVERVSGGSLAELREKVQEAVFVAELATAKVTLTADVFQTSSKLSLVYSLLQSQSDSPKALQLAAELCLHYRLMDPDLWAKLLAALLALDMTKLLQCVLPQLHTQVGSLGSVWQAVVQAPYERGGEAECLPALRLLYQCPMLFKLDLAAIIQAMAAAGAHSHALAASLLLPPSLRTSSVESVLSALPAGGLLQLLEEVKRSSCPQLLLVADEVYAYVDRTGQHECLLGSSHFPDLVHYLIARRRLCSLVTAVLSRGRVAEAARLVELYHAHHKISAPGGEEGLEAYLLAHGNL